jgi:cell division protein ZapB
MQNLESLETRIDQLLQKLQEVRAENQDLRSELESERENRQKVLKKVDQLLQKLQEADID